MKSLKNDYALTCVESYFISWASNFLKDKQLYSESFISIKDVLYDFCYDNATYENYQRAKRVQDTVHEIGASKYKVFSELSNKFDVCRDLVILQVNNHFTERYKIQPWRDDHYICLNKIMTDGYEVINNFPVDSLILSSEELEKYFCGKVVVFEKTDFIDTNISKNKNKIQVELIKNQDINFNIEDIGLIPFRDAIGILKVIRKRLLLWFMSYYEEDYVLNKLTELTKQQIDILDRLYIMAEVQRLRKKIDIKFLLNELDSFLEIEKQVIKIL